MLVNIQNVTSRLRTLKLLICLLCICLVPAVHADESLIELKCQALVNFRDAQENKRVRVENFVISIQSLKAGHIFRISGDTHIRLDASTVRPLATPIQKVDVDSNDWTFKSDQSMLTFNILTGQLMYVEAQTPHGSGPISANGRCTLPLDPLSLH